MVSFNKCIVAGNMTRDPELRFTQQGTPVCDFGIAVNRVRSKQEDAPPDYFNITAWRELGETIANYKKKGAPILVEGRLEYSTWEDQETGNKRSAVKIVADQIQFLPGKNSGSAGGNTASGGSTQSQGAGQQQTAEGDDEEWEDIPF